MAENLLKVIEVLSESDKSWEDAAQQSVARAAKTLHGIKSIYIKNSKPRSTTIKLSNIGSTPVSRSCWIRTVASARWCGEPIPAVGKEFPGDWVYMCPRVLRPMQAPMFIRYSRTCASIVFTPTLRRHTNGYQENN